MGTRIYKSLGIFDVNGELFVAVFRWTCSQRNWSDLLRTKAPGTLGELIPVLLDMGAEMPLIDVLYQGTVGTLTEGVRGGILVGQSEINGKTCDHLAFRQASIDWQLWVEQGPRAIATIGFPPDTVAHAANQRPRVPQAGDQRLEQPRIVRGRVAHPRQQG